MNLADLVKKGSLRWLATATAAAAATQGAVSAGAVATVAGVAVAKTPQAPSVIDAALCDPDRRTWPHSDAMNGAEIEAFMGRFELFAQRGLNQSDAEQHADRLTLRDREGDDRRLCLECAHLRRVGGRRCGNAQRAGMTVHASAAVLAAGFVVQLQRCDGFALIT